MKADIVLDALKMSGIPTVLTDPHRNDNPITFANEAFSTLTGFAIGEIIGRDIHSLQAPGRDPATVLALREAIAARRAISLEILNRKRDGTDFWAELCLAPIFDRNGGFATSSPITSISAADGPPRKRSGNCRKRKRSVS